MNRFTCLLVCVALAVSVVPVAAAAEAEGANVPSPRERQTAVRWVLEGGRLDAEAAAGLEAGLEERPGDLESRIKLLGHYSRERTAAGRQARLGHILWLIGNRPDAAITGLPPAEVDRTQQPDGYAQAKRLWLEQAAKHEKSPRVLGNAASFFLRSDSGEAEKLLLRAKKLDESSPYWSRQLSQLYRLEFQAGKSAAAVRAFAELREAYDKTDNETARMIMFSDLARAAFDAKDYKQAKEFATKALDSSDELEKSWAYGEALHHGHLVMGRLALRTGDLNEAKRRLVEAGKTPGSPTLKTFGPNMSLAHELLQKGERDAILAYFTLCGKFWASGKHKLDTWATQVRGGEAPDFGANLRY